MSVSFLAKAIKKFWHEDISKLLLQDQDLVLGHPSEKLVKSLKFGWSMHGRQGK